MKISLVLKEVKVPPSLVILVYVIKTLSYSLTYRASEGTPSIHLEIDIQPSSLLAKVAVDNPSGVL